MPRGSRVVVMEQVRGRTGEVLGFKGQRKRYCPRQEWSCRWPEEQKGAELHWSWSHR